MKSTTVSSSLYSKTTPKPKADEDNISINSEKIESDEDKINTPGISSNLIVNASFSRHNHENTNNLQTMQLDQQSIISNLVNKKEDNKSLYSFITNDPFSPSNLSSSLRKKGSQQQIMKKSSDEESLVQYKKLMMLLSEKEKESKGLRTNYEEYKKKMQKQKYIFNKNKEHLELVRKNNEMMKLLICKLINSK